MRKRILLLVLLPLMAVSANAQSLLVGDANCDNQVDISDVVFTVNRILADESYKGSCDVNYDGSVDISDVVILVNIILNGDIAYLGCPDDAHPHLIDLGLPSGTKWACCNVGATVPEERGSYYAWGESEGKRVYDWSTYIHCDGVRDTCHDLGANISGTQYDAAHNLWGTPWQMPSDVQADELITHCTAEWTEIDGTNGCKYTGPSGGSIFLPAGGGCYSPFLFDRNNGGYYWLGLQNPEDINRASYLYFSSGDAYCGNGVNRFYGFNIRPVAQGF